MTFDCDVCVIGSGPAGSMAAYELTRKGRSVIVLERGEYLAPQSTVLGNAFQPITEADSLTEVAQGSNGISEILGTMPTIVGGAGEVYGAASHRFLPEDFFLHSKIGTVEQAELADWPFSYDDLEPFYSEAEWILGVSGLAGAEKYPIHRSRPYPLPPLRVESEAVQLFDAAAAKFDFHSFPTPLAILSQSYDGRQPCAACGFCTGQVCLYAAKSSPTVTTLRHAVESGRCQIIAQASVHRLTLSGRKAVAAEYSDYRGNRYHLTARCFVLACGAIFTPRVLLLSVSDKYPNGLGNSFDMVGRFFSSHVISGVHGFFNRPVYLPNTHYVHRSMDDLYFGEPSAWKGGLLQLHLQGGLDHLVIRDRSLGFGTSFVSELKAKTGTSPYVYYCGDTLPQISNRVLLSKTLDRFGFPRARVEYAYHPLDQVSAYHGYTQAVRILREMGASSTSPFSLQWKQVWSSGYHYSGSCRAGNEERRSVVDHQCRIHDSDNVFVCDASIFPTSGGAGPALTLQANALRVAAAVGDSL